MEAEQSITVEVALLRRQLERERRARRSAEEIGEAATAQLWQAVERLELAESELRDRAELTDLSYALSRSLRADLDPERMLDRAVRALGESLGLDRVVVRLVEGSDIGGLVTQWAAPGVPELPVTSRLDENFARLVSDHANRDASLWIDDLDQDDRVSHARDVMDYLQCRAYAGVPLRSGQRLIGWLALHTHRESHVWNDRDRTVANALAHDLSGALLQAQAHQRQLETLRQLQRVDEVKNDLVWRVSHELRTPLASIRGYTELLADGDVGQPTPVQQRTLEVILRNCQRLQSLMENLLTLSVVDHQELPTARDPINVGAVLGRVRDRARALIAGRRIDLLLQDEMPSEVKLRGDEEELERLLVNLLDNAVKFTADGGQVSLAVSVTETTLSFDVSDTGCGIAADDHERVFERFFRTEQATEAEVPGAGLGLALVDSIVRGHGGRVRVFSEVGQGARFRVELPLGAS